MNTTCLIDLVDIILTSNNATLFTQLLSLIKKNHLSFEESRALEIIFSNRIRQGKKEKETPLYEALIQKRGYDNSSISTLQLANLLLETDVSAFNLFLDKFAAYPPPQQASIIGRLKKEIHEKSLQYLQTLCDRLNDFLSNSKKSVATQQLENTTLHTLSAPQNSDQTHSQATEEKKPIKRKTHKPRRISTIQPKILPAPSIPPTLFIVAPEVIQISSLNNILPDDIDTLIWTIINDMLSSFDLNDIERAFVTWGYVNDTSNLSTEAKNHVDMKKYSFTEALKKFRDTTTHLEGKQRFLTYSARENVTYAKDTADLAGALMLLAIAYDSPFIEDNLLLSNEEVISKLITKLRDLCLHQRSLLTAPYFIQTTNTNYIQEPLIQVPFEQHPQQQFFQAPFEEYSQQAFSTPKPEEKPTMSIKMVYPSKLSGIPTTEKRMRDNLIDEHPPKKRKNTHKNKAPPTLTVQDALKQMTKSMTQAGIFSSKTNTSTEKNIPKKNFQGKPFINKQR